jgi:hypothetical protein
MDPESGNVSVVFTASSAGTYTITGNFLGSGTGENSHPVEILDDGTVIWKGTISSFGGKDSFNLSETLNTGGTLTFYVGTQAPPAALIAISAQDSTEPSPKIPRLCPSRALSD